MNNNLAKEIKENRIVKIKNFLLPKELIRLSNIVKDNQNFLNKKISSEIIENFLKDTEFEDSINTTNKYDYNATAGTMIIFDEGGIHRGSKPTLNDRMVIRYLIKPS